MPSMSSLPIPPIQNPAQAEQAPFPTVTLRARARPRRSTAWLDLKDLLKNKGRYFLVFPASRAAELLALLRMRDLEPKRLRFVHPYLHKPASLVLVEAMKSAGIGLDVLPPLIVHEHGGYTEEVRNIYGTSV